MYGGAVVEEGGPGENQLIVDHTDHRTLKESSNQENKESPLQRFAKQGLA